MDVLQNLYSFRDILLQEMFDLLVSLGAKLNIKNKQGLTPLTLAARLARKDVR
jgi:ankyrin repeat protein